MKVSLISSLLLAVSGVSLKPMRGMALESESGEGETLCVRQPFVGGNWKCYGDSASVKKLVASLNMANLPVETTQIVVAPSTIHLPSVNTGLRKDVGVAAQNIALSDSYGAYTGETMAADVASAGSSWAIVGHSERRGMGETDKEIAQKVRTALSSGLNVILCVGETLAERETDLTDDVLEAQLALPAQQLTAEEWSRVVVAYEPRWAIGSGKAASPADVEDAHAVVRDILRSFAGANVANSVRIIYGGSVNGKNASSLAAAKGVDGFLVGKAAMDAQEFETIAHAASRIGGQLTSATKRF